MLWTIHLASAPGEGGVKMINEMIEKNTFFHSYQYLYQLESMTTIGGEFLFRAEYGNPEFIFQIAREADLLYELDTKSIEKAIKTYYSQEGIPLEGLLFINVFPSTILNSKFPSFAAHLLRTFPESYQHVVFEIIEMEKTSNVELLKERIQFLRSCGFQIAMDDVGQGWSSLSLIIELEPDFIKLDRYFSVRLASTLQKQKMIKLLLEYFEDTETRIVLEGIETMNDLHTAQSLGVHLCQGYLLSRPKPLLVG